MTIKHPFCIFREPANDIRWITSEHAKAYEYLEEVPKEAFVISRFTGGGFYLEGIPTTPETFDWDIALPAGIGAKGSTEEAEYVEKVQAAIEAIMSDKIEKVVLSRCIVIPLNADLDLKSIFYKLCEQYPDAFVYILQLEGQLWLGATPEVLLRRDELEVESLSLAGTIKNIEKQTFSPKEEYEQMVVTSYILHKMRNFIESLKIHGPRKLNAGAVSHLATRITGRLKDEKDFAPLVDSMHPTPAVCGLPETAAMEFIHEHEGYERGFYTGYIGFQEKGSSQLYVNLRCAQLFVDSALLYAGGGIVEGSEPEKEWEETVEKMKTMGQLLSGS